MISSLKGKSPVAKDFVRAGFQEGFLIADNNAAKQIGVLYLQAIIRGMELQ